MLMVLDLRRKHYGDGVVAVDCGANLGVHTVEWAKHMTGWGVVLAIEAQERIYYALAGNIAINNCFNARAIHAAVSNRPGTMKMPKPNYFAQCKLRQPRAQEARQHRIHRPADRLFRRQDGRRADDQSRCVQFPPPRSDKDRRRGHGARRLGGRRQMHRRQPSDPAGRGHQDRRGGAARLAGKCSAIRSCRSESISSPSTTTTNACATSRSNRLRRAP